MIGLTLKLGLATPLAFMAPHSVPPAAPPVPQVAPAPMVGQPVVVAPLPPSGGSISPESPKALGPPATIPPPVPPSPPVTTSTGVDCVVTLTDSSGNTVTFSPGPAVNGVCSDGSPEPVTWSGP